MRTIYLSSQPDVEGAPAAATIGFFDGVHRGHRQLLAQVCAEAHERRLTSMAVTFDSHPRAVLRADYQPQLLTPLDEKLQLLSTTGIDVCVVLPFTTELAALTAQQFMQQVLARRLHVQHLVVGYDHRFGHDRTEGVDHYRRYAEALGMSLSTAPALLHKGEAVSSSRVRRLLAEGMIDHATDCLGHPYTITGTVVPGYQKGRQLGFPTANIQVDDPCKLLPQRGAYTVKVRMGEGEPMLRAVMNIGMRPTFHGDHVTIEVHIMDFHEQIYGRQITVEFCHRLRQERQFSSPDALASQLRADVRMANEQFEHDSENNQEQQ